ncbi:MAG: TIGR02186 family protein [Deltaproteobacteria bacterium]|nr:TIGR02186 family protein [Deltaproteobacteria bacterium]
MRRSVVAALLALLVAAPARAVTVEPNPVRVSAFYRGTTVRVRGVTDPGSEVIVIVTGSDTEERFDRKGRVGPLWANLGKLAVSGVPRLHLIAGNAQAVRDRDLVQRHLLDLDALARRARIAPAGAEASAMRAEYVKLKKSKGMFAELQNGVRMDGTAFEAQIPWPDMAPPGEYGVVIFHLHKDGGIRIESAQLVVELVGFPRFVDRMAFEQSFLYGLLSVSVALSVGLLMGLVFKRKGAVGH